MKAGTVPAVSVTTANHDDCDDFTFLDGRFLMSDSTKGVGVISWFDLTVENADEARDFYEKVVGWTSSQVEMGGYSDFNMETPEQETVAGICHARGENADLPAHWMIYINVADLDASVAACERLGGQVISPSRQVGGGRCAIIRDPAGACAALYQAG
jgi:hypothetical protein